MGVALKSFANWDDQLALKSLCRRLKVNIVPLCEASCQIKCLIRNLHIPQGSVVFLTVCVFSNSSLYFLCSHFFSFEQIFGTFESLLIR
jgi:hypothetical protein